MPAVRHAEWTDGMRILGRPANGYGRRRGDLYLDHRRRTEPRVQHRVAELLLRYYARWPDAELRIPAARGFVHIRSRLRRLRIRRKRRDHRLPGVGNGSVHAVRVRYGELQLPGRGPGP